MTEAAHLSLASAPEPVDPETGIPSFEGDHVAMTKAKITSVAGLEIDDRVFRLDDTVKLVIEAKVISIQHVVNETTGVMVRVHVMKAVDCAVIDWAMDMDALRAAL